MKERTRLAILFNETADAPKLIKGVRRLRPHMEIIAILSPRASRQEMEGLVDGFITIELSPLRLLLSASFVKMIRQLRQENFDTLIIRYNTLKLKLLSAWIAPQKAELWLTQGSVIPIEQNSAALIRNHLQQKLIAWGRLLIYSFRVLFIRVK